MDPFKQCPKCRFPWPARTDFLADPRLTLVGYQVNFKALETGLLMFNHICKTTLALPVRVFQDLYDGPVFAQRATGGTDCPGHCLHQSKLDPCPAHCECAFVRHSLQVIRGWPKTNGGGPRPLLE